MPMRSMVDTWPPAAWCIHGHQQHGAYMATSSMVHTWPPAAWCIHAQTSLLAAGSHTQHLQTQRANGLAEVTKWKVHKVVRTSSTPCGPRRHLLAKYLHSGTISVCTKVHSKILSSACSTHRLSAVSKLSCQLLADGTRIAHLCTKPEKPGAGRTSAVYRQDAGTAHNCCLQQAQAHHACGRTCGVHWSAMVDSALECP